MSPVSPTDLPTYDDVRRAAERLAGVAHRTPVLASRALNAQLGAEVFFKCENFQRIGAFKFRGAYNALSLLTPAQRRAGVVAFSSGNHAQAVALAGRLLDTRVTVVMPVDAPAAKKSATRGYGAEIVEYDRLREDREQIARELVAREGRTLIPPFEHPAVIAGQGTAVKELIEEVGELDVLFVPLGGGGLLGGSLLAAHGLSPECAVYGVEPAAGNDAQQSFRSGEIVRIDPPASIADGALTQAMGPTTFALLRRYARDVLTVEDATLLRVMRWLAARMKIVVEPTGCLGAAAMLTQDVDMAGKRVGVVLSGGNVDLAAYAAYLSPARDAGGAL